MESQRQANAELIKQAMSKAFTHGMIAGALVGFLLGALGGYIYAENTADRTVVIPLSEGTKT